MSLSVPVVPSRLPHFTCWEFLHYVGIYNRHRSSADISFIIRSSSYSGGKKSVCYNGLCSRYPQLAELFESSKVRLLLQL